MDFPSVTGVSLLPLLWIFFAVVVFAACVWSAIMLWHWHLYSTGSYTTRTSALVYLAGLASCIVAMASALAWLSL